MNDGVDPHWPQGKGNHTHVQEVGSQLMDPWTKNTISLNWCLTTDVHISFMLWMFDKVLWKRVSGKYYFLFNNFNVDVDAECMYVWINKNTCSYLVLYSCVFSSSICINLDVKVTEFLV
jgi:hypothetical protein